jgi:hypothetical protein
VGREAGREVRRREYGGTVIHKLFDENRGRKSCDILL